MEKNYEKNFIDQFEIDEYSAIPKYKQLVDAVINFIKSDKIKLGEMLPSINELSFNTGISRLTVEKATMSSVK